MMLYTLVQTTSLLFGYLVMFNLADVRSCDVQQIINFDYCHCVCFDVVWLPIVYS